MNGFIDLHTHSTYSDGTFTPTQLVKSASDIGLKAIALTDHDTIDGLEEAIENGKKYNIEVITGIEFSVDSDTEMHLLGLGFSLDCPEIKNELKEMIIQRKVRCEKTIGMLNNIGINVSMSDVEEQATSNIIGRSQIAKAMIKKGYVKSVKEAFDKYLSFGKPAFTARKSLTPEKAIEIIKNSNGIASLAHLNQIKKSDDELYEILVKLKNAGLDAIEGYYTEYDEEMNRKYRKFALEIGLKLTGGSDFHGTNKENHNLGTGCGNLKIPYELLNQFR